MNGPGPLRALARAAAQLGDPALLRVLLGSIAGAGAFFALLVWGAIAAVHTASGLHGALAALAEAAAGLAVAAATWFLFVPVAVAIASICLEPVARAVERRWHPGLPPPAGGASLAVQLGDALALGAKVLAASLLALGLAIALPGIGLVPGFLVTAWAAGRGLFVGIAMRRMRRPEALRLYAAARMSALAEGALLAGLAAIPFLNLLVPVLGAAAMVHLVARRLPTAPGVSRRTPPTSSRTFR